MSLKDRLPKDLKFLLSPRFWAMVLVIVSSVLTGDLTPVEGLQAFGAGFLGIGTFDRFSDKIAAGKKVVPFYGTKEDTIQ